MLLLVIGDEALEIADAQRLNLLAHQTTAFAVVFLWADAPGNGGEHVVFADFGGRAKKVPGDDQLHEFANLHAYWAIVRAGRLGALQAAQGFLPGKFSRVAEVHFA